MRVVVLTNPAAGTKADAAAALRRAMEAAGAEAEVRQVYGDRLTPEAARAAAQGVDAVVAAGGDGTVSAVAAALLGSPTPLGVLPTGTLNHFAKDLQLPLTVPEAARVIARGVVKPIDVGEVNGRPFINNASIGLYPRIVQKRDRQRQRFGRGKWVSTLLAFVSVFRRCPTVRVRIGIGDQTVLRTTPFVFVGNNRYETSLTTLGGRGAIDRGELCLYFANRTGRFGLLRLALRALFGRLEQAKDFDAMIVKEAWIETSKRSLRVAIDGEVVRLAPPLHFVIRPQALRVLVAPATAPERAGADRAM
jgi:diacylglycerol kinase family enzyme